MAWIPSVVRSLCVPVREVVPSAETVVYPVLLERAAYPVFCKVPLKLLEHNKSVLRTQEVRQRVVLPL